jgi:hypothetical protein
VGQVIKSRASRRIDLWRPARVILLNDDAPRQVSSAFENRKAPVAAFGYLGPVTAVGT